MIITFFASYESNKEDTNEKNDDYLDGGTVSGEKIIQG